MKTRHLELASRERQACTPNQTLPNRAIVRNRAWASRWIQRQVGRGMGS